MVAALGLPAVAAADEAPKAAAPITVELSGSPRGIALQYAARPGDYDSICVAPCTARVTPGWNYRIMNPEGPSPDLELTTDSKVHVRLHSQKRDEGGGIFIVMGSCVFAAGLISFGLAGIIAASNGTNTKVFLGVGGAAAGAGLALATPGIVLLSTNSEVVEINGKRQGKGAKLTLTPFGVTF